MTTHIAQLLLSLASAPKRLRILDLCTGTGCISLLLHSLLFRYHENLQIHGVDVSPNAIALARKNLGYNIRAGPLNARAASEVTFQEADVLNENLTEHIEGAADDLEGREGWDVLISNPPYISPNAFNISTSLSVRRFEPKLALVPPSKPLRTDAEVADLFYPHLLHLANTLAVKVFAVEVADLDQARRIMKLALESKREWEGCEIWRDWPSQGKGEEDVVDVGGRNIKVKGEGHGRAVVAWRA